MPKSLIIIFNFHSKIFHSTLLIHSVGTILFIYPPSRPALVGFRQNDPSLQRPATLMFLSSWCANLKGPTAAAANAVGHSSLWLFSCEHCKYCFTLQLLSTTARVSQRSIIDNVGVQMITCRYLLHVEMPLRDWLPLWQWMTIWFVYHEILWQHIQ